jgi:hypothetical protein
MTTENLMGRNLGPNLAVDLVKCLGHCWVPKMDRTLAVFNNKDTDACNI